MKEERPIFTDNLTLAGRLLFIFCVLFFAVGFYLGFCRVADSGVSFPLFVVFIPPVVVSIFLFFGGAWLLERCDIKIYTAKIRQGEGLENTIQESKKHNPKDSFE
jgi:hypothetical protein